MKRFPVLIMLLTFLYLTQRPIVAYVDLSGVDNYPEAQAAVGIIEAFSEEKMLSSDYFADRFIHIHWSDLLPDGSLGVAANQPMSCTILLSRELLGKNYTSEDITFVLLHEITHCFWVWHDERNSNSLMFPYYSGFPSAQTSVESVVELVKMIDKARRKRAILIHTK